jgi:hypothetical protein
MRDLPPPFRFDLSSLLSRARDKLNTHVEGFEINLPFVTFNVKADDLEEKVAREIVIRMADCRVLNASECCDDCIDMALESIQKIRSILIDKQVELAKVTNGGLYCLIEIMADAIRQFLTFEQRLARQGSKHSKLVNVHNRYEQRDAYFTGLEMLRAHLHRTLVQIAKIAGIQIPKIAEHMRYKEDWQLEAYVPLSLPKAKGGKTI